MDSPQPETSSSDEPASTDNSASPPRPAPFLGCGAIAALLLGGGLYMLILFVGPGLAALLVGIEASYTNPSDSDPVATVFGSTAVLLICAGFALLWPLFRYMGLPRPVATLCLLTAVVGVVYLQLFITVSLFDVSSIDWPLWSAGWATALSGLAVLAVLVWTQGHGFRWAATAIIIVAVLRALADQSTSIREEREEFDNVAQTVSGYPGHIALVESEEWSAVQAWNFQDEYLSLDYETSDGDRIEVTTWMDFTADAPGDPDPADPIRHRCDSEHLTCEMTEETGLTVVTVQDKDHLERDLVRVQWRPGVYVEIRSREGAGLEDLRALVGRLRPSEEGDAVALAEEITGGPRR
ncbi:hypothetical protein [Nocardiopsis lambiniae]|uniref:Uncharacterized protein n=1 Tax=Nocardiopsis lambiniae TaxID=3075539 RepID=A0ABU2MFG9_9ACTN|nr:hypothetical protein [Nocardiopsis sp. DSM 44743]MDT0331443.1 hypothetical protein [Nocardiopsis sp. DSM 44743]